MQGREAVKTASKSKFPLGIVVATPGALEAMSPDDMAQAIRAHESGEWGEVPAEDAAANERALVDGDRLLSAYKTSRGVRFWIITEADRSATTVLLPEEY